MLLNIDYQIWKAVASDLSRYTLTMVHIEADPGADPGSDGYLTGTACATDGFIMAVVPILLHKDDIPGFVTVEACQASYKIARKLKLAELAIDLTKPDLYGIPDGSYLARTEDPGTFPDWKPIVPTRPTPQEKNDQARLMACSFQPGLMVKVYQAIGVQTALYGRGSGTGSGIGRLVFPKANYKTGGVTEPIIVEPVEAKIESRFSPPYGLVMPMHDTEKIQGSYWHQAEKNSKF